MEEATRAATHPAGQRARGEAAHTRTRERIQSVALELFAEQGYQRTSLREISERLGVTKAALYYHFRSKEDIVRSFTEDYRAELDALIAWGSAQPRTAATRGLILERYADIVGGRLAVMRFLEHNQAAVQSLMSKDGQGRKVFSEQFLHLRDLLTPPEATLAGRVRASLAVASVGLGWMLFRTEAPDSAELRDIVVGIGAELAGADLPPARQAAGAAAGSAAAQASATGSTAAGSAAAQASATGSTAAGSAAAQASTAAQASAAPGH